MTSLDPQNRRLIDDVVAGDVPSPETQAALWHKLGSRLDGTLSPEAAAASHGLSASGGLAVGAGPLLKLVVVTALAGAAVVGVSNYPGADADATATATARTVAPDSLRGDAASPRPDKHATQPAALPQPQPQPQPAAPWLEHSPKRAAAAPSSRAQPAQRGHNAQDANAVKGAAVSGPSSADNGGLAAETQLMSAAQSALTGHQPALALRLIERHAARFPKGELAQAREAARVFALCALGRTSDAARARQAFRRDWATSPLMARVESSCSP